MAYSATLDRTAPGMERGRGKSRKPPFLAAGGRLPASETLALGFARQGGQYRGCQAPDGGTARGCAIYDLPRNDPAPLRGIMLDPKLRGGFDGIFAPGKPYSASTPAVAR